MSAPEGVDPGPDVVVEHQGGALWVTLNRPQAANALTPDQRNQLIDFLDSASGDPATRVVVLAAGGRHFCSGADLSGADLSSADLTDAILVGAKMTHWTVDKANMTDVLTDAPFGAPLKNLPYAEMLAQHALWCESGGSAGSPSVFDGADLRELKSVRTLNLTALSAKGAVFYGLDMEGVQLQGAHLEGADLRCCNLRGADLRGARLVGAKLSGSDLRQAHLGPLMIRGTDLLPADLPRAIFKGSDLTRADLRGAVMKEADFERAILTGAQLRLLDLVEAHTAGVHGLPRD